MPCAFDDLLVRSLDWDSKRSHSLGFLARNALCNMRKRRLRPVPDGIRAVGLERG